ncbi:MAG: ATP synthase F1 subunit epsilon [Elusimicrobiota bacterium]|jgi:F-type H+-transporting ATPase subunit epsilon|nr:ATP synthase F1 subunit epsilon [Elusimicrobiota bacterium]
MNTFDFEILSPNGITFKGQASQATFPTMAGQITILPGHANLVTVLKRGAIDFVTAEGSKKITVSGGFLEVAGSRVSVVALFAMSADQVSEDLLGKAAAEVKRISEKRKEFDITVAQMQLKKDIATLKVGAIKSKRKI